MNPDSIPYHLRQYVRENIHYLCNVFEVFTIGRLANEDPIRVVLSDVNNVNINMDYLITPLALRILDLEIGNLFRDLGGGGDGGDADGGDGDGGDGGGGGDGGDGGDGDGGDGGDGGGADAGGDAGDGDGGDGGDGDGGDGDAGDAGAGAGDAGGADAGDGGGGGGDGGGDAGGADAGADAGGAALGGGGAGAAYVGPYAEFLTNNNANMFRICFAYELLLKVVKYELQKKTYHNHVYFELLNLEIDRMRERKDDLLLQQYGQTINGHDAFTEHKAAIRRQTEQRSYTAYFASSVFVSNNLEDKPHTSETAIEKFCKNEAEIVQPPPAIYTNNFINTYLVTDTYDVTLGNANIRTGFMNECWTSREYPTPPQNEKRCLLEAFRQLYSYYSEDTEENRNKHLINYHIFVCLRTKWECKKDPKLDDLNICIESHQKNSTNNEIAVMTESINMTKVCTLARKTPLRSVLLYCVLNGIIGNDDQKTRLIQNIRTGEDIEEIRREIITLVCPPPP